MFRQKMFELRILFWVSECIVLCLRLLPTTIIISKKSQKKKLYHHLLRLPVCVRERTELALASMLKKISSLSVFCLTFDLIYIFSFFLHVLSPPLVSTEQQ